MDTLPNSQVPAKYAREIKRMLKEKNAVLLAHYYQEPQIQDLADFVGDSLSLANEAAKSEAKLIVFAGVHFMAETVKIMNPDKTVVVPDLSASCSLAESCTADSFKEFIDSHPDHTVVSYINTTADVKAISDIICTSSNAEKIIRSIPEEQPIIFGPNKNMGKYLNEKTGRNMLLWDGICVVHEAFALNKITELVKQYPEAKIIAHPESHASILKIASFIGSTSALIKYAREDNATTYIVATEVGILHKMKMQVADKKLIPAPIAEDNSCACSECAYMKLNTLEKLYYCIKNENPKVELTEQLRTSALRPIERMLEIS
ncbi:MAG TPA: quinolinate synthase [Flavobacteriales bacterium]|nr:quinolinate synthase [Flavobacteriales bacterium]